MHKALLASASGLRRAVLQMHRPLADPELGWLSCATCLDVGHASWAQFPCATYVLARDSKDEA